ncbi:MAG: AraC family transcriptional regulator [Eubacteriales bacterium]|nr:AraC family transcriptional regulator [Eubacteriales bacterium]
MPIRSRVFKRYVLSYLSVVLAVCMALGLALVRVASGQLRQAETEVYQARLAQTADYIERQLSTMEDIRLDVKTRLPFQPFYLNRQKTNEFELLDAFSRYAGFSPWIEEYYLWYQDDGKVFGTRSTYSERIFFQRVMKGMSAERMTEALPEAGKMLFQVPETRPDTLMIALPFYFGTARIPTGRCTLIFLVKLAQLRQTIWQMTGQPFDSGFALEYEGQTVLSTLTAERTLSGQGTKEKARVVIEEPSIAGLERLGSFERLMIWIVVLAVLLGTAIAVYAAWRSYQPIRKLYAKYGGSQKPSNELQTLEDLLSNSLKRNSFSQKQIEEQMEQLDLQQSWLKQQLVMMLITGNDSPVVKELIQKMGFEMSHAHFALCFLYLQGDEGDRTGLVRSIEDFSDEECTLYAAELQENREYIVLMNFQEEEQCRDLLELLSDSLESRNLSVRVQWSRTCSQLNEIASAAIETLNTPPVALAVDNAEAEEEDALEQMAALTESGSTSQALALLETMIAQTENRYPSYLMRIYMLNRLVQQMMTLASREGVTLPPKSPGQDPDSVRETLEQLVRALCRKGAQRSSAEKPEGGKTAAYVREHCLDGDISLSSTAEALGISTKQVSRLLRMEVDMTFKEYLLHLRMSAAQDFLREEGLSIAETAGRVGYFNISHFIKCFKAYTGMTPGEWKKLSSGRTME